MAGRSLRRLAFWPSSICINACCLPHWVKVLAKDGYSTVYRHRLCGTFRGRMAGPAWCAPFWSPWFLIAPIQVVYFYSVFTRLQEFSVVSLSYSAPTFYSSHSSGTHKYPHAEFSLVIPPPAQIQVSPNGSPNDWTRYTE